MEVYYVRFYRNRKLFYDGYAVKKANTFFIGYTDDTLLISSGGCFAEIDVEGEIMSTSIETKELDVLNYFPLDTELEYGFGGDDSFKIIFKRSNDVTAEHVIETVKEKTPIFSANTRIFLHFMNATKM